MPDVSDILDLLQNTNSEPTPQPRTWGPFSHNSVRMISNIQASLVPSCCASSPNDPIEEDDTDDWLDRTMSFAIVLTNCQESWASKLNSSYHPTLFSSYRPRFSSSCLRLYMTYSVYLENEVQEEVPTTCLPCSKLAQHADDQVSSVQVILLDH